MNNNTIASNTIDEDNAHDYGKGEPAFELDNVHDNGEGAPNKGRPNLNKVVSGIAVSALPKHIRASAYELDKNHDGRLGTEEIASALFELKKKEKTNRTLKQTVVGIVVLCVLLIVSIFGASMVAIVLTQDITVDHDNGFAYVKGSLDVMKTSEAIIFEEGISIADMSNDELVDLKMLNLDDGNIRFDIKGFARNKYDDTIILLTEGGSLTYNFEGIIDSTGQARALLEAVFGEEIHVEGSEGQRTLWAVCGKESNQAGSSQTSNDKEEKDKKKKKKKEEEEEESEESEE